MTTIRNQILDAVVFALNTDKPADVPEARRKRFSSIEYEQLPIIDVTVLNEQVVPVGGGGGPIVRRAMTIGVRCWAGGDAPEVASDQMVGWATKALAGNRLGGLAMDIEETETIWESEAMDAVLGVAEVHFQVEYTTQTSDQEKKA